MSESQFAHSGSGILQKKIDTLITSIAAVEQGIPGAIIIHDLRDSSVVYMSKWGRDYLGVSMDELKRMGIEYHGRFFNPRDAKDYVPKILGLLERNNNDELVSFFQQVRPSSQHDWAWFSSATKILFRDETSKPLLTLTIATPVDVQHRITGRGQRILEENNFLRNNYHVFDQLTKREKEILRMMATGDSSVKMAKRLNISEKTAATHRRNIKRKLKIESNYDIIRYAQAFDLI